jgi:uncharacterized membrane protein YhaH (DUF805 family)
MEYIKQGLSNWTNPSGRSSRAEYWSTLITLNLLALILIFVNEALYSLLTLFSLFVGISLGIRRMHDAGVNGWFILIPLVNFLYAFSKSEQKENKWGPVPKESSLNSNKPSELIKNIETNQDSPEELKELEQRLNDLKKLEKEKDEKIQKQDKSEERLAESFLEKQSEIFQEEYKIAKDIVEEELVKKSKKLQDLVKKIEMLEIEIEKKSSDLAIKEIENNKREMLLRKIKQLEEENENE